MDNLAVLSSKIKPSMSSLEIADLTGKKHCHVLRDIKVMLDQLGITPNEHLDYADPTAVRVERDYRHFISVIYLPRDETFTLLTGYSPDLFGMILDRVRELETQLRKPKSIFEQITDDPSNMRALQAHMLQKIDALNKQPALAQDSTLSAAAAARAWADQYERDAVATVKAVQQ